MFNYLIIKLYIFCHIDILHFIQSLLMAARQVVIVNCSAHSKHNQILKLANTGMIHRPNSKERAHPFRNEIAIA